MQGKLGIRASPASQASHNSLNVSLGFSPVYALFDVPKCFKNVFVMLHAFFFFFAALL
jgi:hypothetical protein